MARTEPARAVLVAREKRNACESVGAVRLADVPPRRGVKLKHVLQLHHAGGAAVFVCILGGPRGCVGRYVRTGAGARRGECFESSDRFKGGQHVSGVCER